MLSRIHRLRALWLPRSYLRNHGLAGPSAYGEGTEGITIYGHIDDDYKEALQPQQARPFDEPSISRDAVTFTCVRSLAIEGIVRPMKPRQQNFFNVCSICGIVCCHHARPPITRQRRQILQAALGTPESSSKDLFETTTYTFPHETRDGFCVFFDHDTRKCRVYAVKPETCVAGPITFDINLHTGKLELYLKLESICPLAGQLRKDPQVFGTHVNAAKRELLRLVHDLDADALAAILHIDEPDTRKIGEVALSPNILNKLWAAQAHRQGPVDPDA